MGKLRTPYPRKDRKWVGKQRDLRKISGKTATSGEMEGWKPQTEVSIPEERPQVGGETKIFRDQNFTSALIFPLKVQALSKI